MPSALFELSSILWFVKTKIPEKYLGGSEMWNMILRTFYLHRKFLCNGMKKLMAFIFSHFVFMVKKEKWVDAKIWRSFHETRLHARTRETCCSKEARTSRHKSVAFFWWFVRFQQQMLFEVMEMQSFEMCFITSDKPHVGRKCGADRNDRKMWNCCKTKLRFLDVLLRISNLIFLFQSEYIESF